jgi:predicted ATPase
VSAQLRLFEEMLDGLERAAAPGGLLVVIEDLHWADPSARRRRWRRGGTAADGVCAIP